MSVVDCGHWHALHCSSIQTHSIQFLSTFREFVPLIDSSSQRSRSILISIMILIIWWVNDSLYTKIHTNNVVSEMNRIDSRLTVSNLLTMIRDNIFLRRWESSCSSLLSQKGMTIFTCLHIVFQLYRIWMTHFIKCGILLWIEILW